MHSTEFEVIESLQGVLGVRTYIPASSRELAGGLQREVGVPDSVSNGFEIINLIDHGERKVGYWTLSKGIRRARTPIKDRVLQSSYGLLSVWITDYFEVPVFVMAIFTTKAMDENSERAPSQEIGKIIWLILLTIFFAQRDTLSKNLSKFVMFVWLIVVLVIFTSYTATLTSLLTVEQFELATKGGVVGFHGGSFVEGVTINNVRLIDNTKKDYYSYEDYANALSKGGNRGGADAILDEVPYIRMFLGDDYAMVLSESCTSGFGF
ncbi:glutamate receptor 1.2-like protein, partial [Tanacetum coccineum]